MYFILVGLSLVWAGSQAQESLTIAKPRCTGLNEIANDCYSPCEKTCYTRFRSDGKVCTLECRQGCSCKPGYLRHNNGTCVPEYQCSPPKCNDDEFFNSCGSCETTCDNQGDTCRACTAACIPGCYCKEGTIRGPGGIGAKCLTTCPKKTCKKNEVFDTCPNNCFTGKCQDLWTRYDCSKALDCCTPSCVCRSGYYRNDAGVCITTQQCIATRGQ